MSTSSGPFGDLTLRGAQGYDADENPVDLHELQSAIRALEAAAARLPTRARARALVIIRESNESDMTLMDGIAASTAGTFADIPGADVVARYGVRLLTEPETCGVVYRIIRNGRARAVLVDFDGYYWLLSAYSAAKSNSKGENDFTLMLCDLILQLRPHRLCAVTFSRFVRSFQHGTDLLSQVIRHVDVVQAGDTKMAMTGPEQTNGLMMWQMMATIASAEREAILQRLTAGKVNLYTRRQGWILGPNALPPGFTFDPATQVLSRVDEMQPIVQMMIELLAARDCPSWRIVRLLADPDWSADAGYAGPPLLTPKIIRTGGKLTDLRASSLVRSWTYWLPLLRDGVYLHRVRSPFPGATRFSNMEVTPSEVEGQPGLLDFRYDLGVPAGGWAPQELILAAMGRAGYRQSGTGAAHRRSPFVGVQWHRQDIQYSLTSNNRRQYELRARTTPAVTTR